MKYGKIFITAVLCLCMTGCSGTPLYDPFSSETEASSAPGSEAEAPVDLYELIYRPLASYSEKFTIKGNHDISETEKVMGMIRNDHPEIFWVTGFSISSSPLKTEIEIDVMNGYSKQELMTMQQELSDAANAVVRSIPPGLSVQDKIIYIHDHIAETTVYDHSSAESSKNDLCGTAYGCIVQGKAVCQGYAEAFKYYMDLIGISCGTVTGTASSSDPYSQNGVPISHAWNYVAVNGRNYWIDVTWDDPDDGVAGDPILHTYCLIDDKRLFRSRTLDPDQDVPVCNSMDENYFVRRGAYVNPYSRENVGNALAASYNDNGSEIMFADKASYDEAMTDLFENDGLWELSDYVDIGEKVNYTTDDTMYVLKIAYE